jgi:hypothetical protein
VKHRFPITFLWRILAAVWLTSLVMLSPITSSSATNNGVLGAPGQFPAVSLSTAPEYVNYRTFNGFFLGSSSGARRPAFLPKVYGTNGSELADDLDLYARLHRHQAGAQSLSQVPCTVTSPSHAPFETLQLTFTVACSGSTRVALPISYNAFSKVYAEEAGGKRRPISYAHVRTDPRIVIDVASSRTETVVVHLPTLWGILS